jgi:hypothetical protein
MEIDETANIGFVLRAPRQGLHDEQILDRDDWDAACPDRDPRCPADRIALEPGHPEREIDSDPGRTMPQREDEGGGYDVLDTRKQGLERRFRKSSDQSQCIVDIGLDDQINIDRHARLSAERHREASNQSA